MIRGKVAEYMERAEKLKQHLNQADNRKKPAAMGANGKSAGGSGKGSKYITCSTVSAISLHDSLETTTKKNKTRTPRNFAVRSPVLSFPKHPTSNGRMWQVWNKQRKP